MPDHINIRHPDERHRDWRHIKEVALLKTELDIAGKRIIELEADLESIFIRIQQGDVVWLCQGDDKIIISAVADDAAADS